MLFSGKLKTMSAAAEVAAVEAAAPALDADAEPAWEEHEAWFNRVRVLSRSEEHRALLRQSGPVLGALALGARQTGATAGVATAALSCFANFVVGDSEACAACRRLHDAGLLGVVLERCIATTTAAAATAATTTPAVDGAHEAGEAGKTDEADEVAQTRQAAGLQMVCAIALGNFARQLHESVETQPFLEALAREGRLVEAALRLSSLGGSAAVRRAAVDCVHELCERSPILRAAFADVDVASAGFLAEAPATAESIGLLAAFCAGAAADEDAPSLQLVRRLGELRFVDGVLGFMEQGAADEWSQGAAVLLALAVDNERAAALEAESAVLRRVAGLLGKLLERLRAQEREREREAKGQTEGDEDEDEVDGEDTVKATGKDEDKDEDNDEDKTEDEDEGGDGSDAFLEAGVVLAQVIATQALSQGQAAPNADFVRVRDSLMGVASACSVQYDRLLRRIQDGPASGATAAAATAAAATGAVVVAGAGAGAGAGAEAGGNPAGSAAENDALRSAILPHARLRLHCLGGLNALASSQQRAHALVHAPSAPAQATPAAAAAAAAAGAEPSLSPSEPEPERPEPVRMALAVAEASFMFDIEASRYALNIVRNVCLDPALHEVVLDSHADAGALLERVATGSRDPSAAGLAGAALRLLAAQRDAATLDRLFRGDTLRHLVCTDQRQILAFAFVELARMLAHVVVAKPGLEQLQTTAAMSKIVFLLQSEAAALHLEALEALELAPTPVLLSINSSTKLQLTPRQPQQQQQAQQQQLAQQQAQSSAGVEQVTLKDRLQQLTAPAEVATKAASVLARLS